MNTMSDTYRGRTFLCDTYRISGTDRSKGQTVNYSQPAKCDILRLWDIDPLIILFMHLSSCVHHRDAVKCAGTTNQCWKIQFVKADTGERRRQPLFTDQLLRRTKDVRVGECRKRKWKSSKRPVRSRISIRRWENVGINSKWWDWKKTTLTFT